MGNSTLEELWYGNINPREQSFENNQQIKELLTLIDRNRDRLNENLTEAQRENFEKYDDCVKEMHCIVEQEIFAYAFRFGARLMLSVLTDNGEAE